MSARPDRQSLPYRDCVGVAVFNQEGNVFIGRRKPDDMTEDRTEVEAPWQMPQGGIDKGEEPYAAALRELYEETSIRSVTRLGEVEEWLSYDLPGRIAGEAWKGRYRGQTQKWYALRFTGADAEINILRPGGGKHKPEFMDWRWEEIDAVVDLIIPFKREVYVEVVKQFRRFAQG